MIQINSKVIGLTGLSGSGKTTISNILKDHAFIIDADQISRFVLEYGTECYFEIVEIFGNEILFHNRDIDRKKLGEIIFANKEKHRILTEITHKYIIKIIIDKIDEMKSKNEKYIVIDIPILIGNEVEKLVDEIWVVYADEEILLERIAQRDGVTIENGKNRLDKQMPQKELISYADVLIENNNKSMSQLEKEVLEKL